MLLTVQDVGFIFGSAAETAWLRIGTYIVAGLAVAFLVLLPLFLWLRRHVKDKKTRITLKKKQNPSITLPQDADPDAATAWLLSERQAVFMQKLSGDPEAYLKKAVDASASYPHRLAALKRVAVELSMENAERRRLTETAAEPAYFVDNGIRVRGYKPLKTRTQAARTAYKKAIRAKGSGRTPMLTFTLSRQDIFSLIDRIRASGAYPVAVRAASGADGSPDELTVGKWTAALVYRYLSAFCLVLAADEAHMKQLQRRYPAAKPTEKLPGFCTVKIDGSFASKEEVFRLIEDAVCQVYYARYSVFYGEAETDEEEARGESERLTALVRGGLVPYSLLTALSAERRRAAAVWMRYTKGRWEWNEIVEILAFCQTKTVTLTDGRHWYEPAVLCVKNVPFLRLFLHGGLPVLYLKLSESLEKKLNAYHAELCRSDADADWFILPVSGAFRTGEEIKSLIDAVARENQK